VRPGPGPAGLVALQRQAGNRAVTGLIQVQRATELRQGSHGEEVKKAQRELSRVQASALPLTEDGAYGPLTTSAVRRFQTTSGAAPPTGVLTIPTWTALDATFNALPPPVRTVLTPGTDHADVGFAQQKLNAIGVTPRLTVNAVYGPEMRTPVMAFEILVLHRFPTGVVDAAFWTALDNARPGGFVALEGASATPVEQLVDSGTANALGTQSPGTSLHPVVGAGNVTSGTSVRELQEKLNTAGAAAPPLKTDGRFGPKTTAALQAFQGSRVPPLAQTGIADAATWAAIDAAAPASRVGFVSRQWTEEVGGHVYGLTSRYSYEIQANRMLVTVLVRFTGLTPPSAWFGHVGAAWNKYQGVRDAPAKKMPIDFEMKRGSGAESMTINVVAGTGRANAGRWFVGDTDAANTVAHEYGHLIGLRDEYQQHPGDYVAATGHEPPVGQTTGPAGQTPQTIAQALQNAMVARNDTNAFNATSGAGMQVGAFAQRVVAAYAALPTVTVPPTPGSPGPPPVAALPAVPLSGNLARDLDRALPDTTNRYETIQVLTYSSGSVMGDPGRAADPHDHGSQPRHVQQFVDVLARTLGGAWRAERR
jgi:peptidoglycan hydrolase-like protein with peptidoglycan-binding domain